MAEFDAPQSRNEAILQNMLGANNELGEPQSRIEELLIQILEQGGGGGGGGKVFTASVNSSTAAELTDAIAADEVILVKDPVTGSESVSLKASISGAYVTLICAGIKTDESGTRRPEFVFYVVAGAAWDARYLGCALGNEVPFIAEPNVTSDTLLRQAITAKRQIVVAPSGVLTMLQTVICAENLGAAGAGVYLITADITEDTDRWNRLRPTFHAYTVLGNVWTAADPLEAVIEDDFANIVNSLPTVGVPKTRYLLKVPDISTEGYHLDEYIYTENKWICISRDNVVRVKTNVTTETELTAAIGEGKVILITDTASASVAVAHSVVSTNYVDLYTIEHDTTSADIAPIFRRHRVAGTVWTIASVAMLPFMATIDVTTEAQLKAAIDAQREILVTVSGTAQPYHTAIYAENLGAAGAYIITADITTDTDRWNRLRPTFHAYTVLGNVWTAADPLEAVVEDDFANIVNALPTVGVPKTRYLLKVPDIITEGYHLDEYIYTENKWICISRDNVVRVKTNVTTETELAAAISAGKVILITDTASASVAVAHSVVSANYIDLYTIEHDTTSADIAPTYRRHRVAGAVWTITSVAMLPFMATIDVTTEAQLKAAIDAQREILVTVSGTAQPYHTAIYAENLGAAGAYIITADITTDTDRWNRLRPTFHAYTVLGNVWTAADPLEAVVEDDFANIVNALPTVGVPKTRYLLKVLDTSAAGYHLDEYLYDNGQWINISKDGSALVAILNVTTAAAIKSAIEAGRVILVKGSAAAQSYRVATKAEILTGNSIKLATFEAGSRPTVGTPITSVTVYTVDGTTNAWSASTTEGEIYIATVGVTTFSELSTAIGSSKPIFVKETTTGALMPALRAEANENAAIVQVLITATDPDTEAITCTIDRYTVTGSTWALSEIGLAIADNYYTKTEIDQDITNIWQEFSDRRRVLHILIRKNNDAGQFPMGWVAIVTANTQETYASFCTWLYSKSYRSPETAYGLTGGCCGTTGVRNSADTGTAYVGRITSGAYSTNGTSLCFKFDYNGTVTDIPESRCAIISFPLS